MRSIELFQLSFQKAQKLMEAHVAGQPRGRPPTGVGEDILRMALVFSLASLDAYIHKRINEVTRVIMDKERRVPESCITYVVSGFKKDNRDRELLKVALQPKSQYSIGQLLIQALKKDTFQKSTQLGKAFEMMEIRKPWLKLARRIGIKRGTSVKILVDKLADRRDLIVHECDIYYGNRHHGKSRSMSREQTRKDITFLYRFVLAVERITNEKIKL